MRTTSPDPSHTSGHYRLERPRVANKVLLDAINAVGGLLATLLVLTKVAADEGLKRRANHVHQPDLDCSPAAEACGLADLGTLENGHDDGLKAKDVELRRWTGDSARALKVAMVEEERENFTMGKGEG
jgi:hypothetical protein